LTEGKTVGTSAAGVIRLNQEESLCITAPVVSGIGETEILKRITIAIVNQPPDMVLAEVLVLSKQITITDCEVFNNKVLVNGTLKKLLHPVFSPFPVPGVTSSDCELTVGSSPFTAILRCNISACIPVPGACPGDQCVVEEACITAEQDFLIDENNDQIPDRFEEKLCIRIRVKTIRNQQVTISPETPSICPEVSTLAPCPAPPCPPQIGLPITTIVQRQGM
jgi:hypothetical protein